MKTARITLIVWGLASLCCAIHSFLPLGFTKQSTASALSSIENEYLDLKAMNRKERESYASFKTIIVSNEKVAWQVAQIRQKIILVLGIGSAALSFVLAFYLPHLIKHLGENANLANEGLCT